MNTAFVAFRLSKPPFKIEVVLRQVRCLSSDEQPRGKTRHHAAHVALYRVIALVELRLQTLALRLPLGRCTRRRFKRRLDRPDRLNVGQQRLLDVLHGRQPAVNVAR